MEDRMDSKGWGKLQLIGDSPHTVPHMVRAHAALAQLPSCREREVGS